MATTKRVREPHLDRIEIWDCDNCGGQFPVLKKGPFSNFCPSCGDETWLSDDDRERIETEEEEDNF